MSQTPRTDSMSSHKDQLWMNHALVLYFVPTRFAQTLEKESATLEQTIELLKSENTTLRNYLMTLASDGAKPGDSKTIWRKVRGEMI